MNLQAQLLRLLGSKGFNPVKAAAGSNAPGLVFSLFTGALQLLQGKGEFSRIDALAADSRRQAAVLAQDLTLDGPQGEVLLRPQPEDEGIGEEAL